MLIREVYSNAKKHFHLSVFTLLPFSKQLVLLFGHASLNESYFSGS